MGDHISGREPIRPIRETITSVADVGVSDSFVEVLSPQPLRRATSTEKDKLASFR